MGLKEEQAIANLDFAFAERRIKGSYGKHLKIELDVESFISDLEAILCSDARGAFIISSAIIRVCDEALGKEAFEQKAITKIILKNQAAGSRAISVKGGALIMACAFASNDDRYQEFEATEELESQL
ncbi:hypothetical protein WSM22_18650 [Cytophagales bacterium WSM2-2]|nr:hypothetical protein WSM22_18650 [Cytophagales bacterium WSM2-2]